MTIVRLARVAVVAVACAGCSWRTGTAMYEQPPTMDFHLVSSDPADGATGVALNHPLVLTFSDFPDPASVAFPQITLRSGGNSFDFSSRVDLIGRSIVITPKSNFTPSTSYTIDLATVQAQGGAIQSLAKRGLVSATNPQDQHVLISFQSGTSTETLPPPPDLSFARDIAPILFDTADVPDAGIDEDGGPRLPSCAQAGCHDSATRSEGLDLTAKFGLASLVNIASHEKPDLDRVKPGDPAFSYVMRKLLGTPGISGVPMPYGQTWPDENVRLVSDWILGGAKP